MLIPDGHAAAFRRSFLKESVEQARRKHTIGEREQKISFSELLQFRALCDRGDADGFQAGIPAYLRFDGFLRALRQYGRLKDSGPVQCQEASNQNGQSADPHPGRRGSGQNHERAMRSVRNGGQFGCFRPEESYGMGAAPKSCDIVAKVFSLMANPSRGLKRKRRVRTGNLCLTR